MVLGRHDRHKRTRFPSESLETETPPDFLARVQTPSPLMSDLPEWPKELPWLQFDPYFRQALSTFTSHAMAGPLFKPPGQGALLIEMMRPHITKRYIELLYPLGSIRLHPQRRMRASLELIAPQVHEGDHGITAEILHTGSQASLAVEVVWLLIYLEANNMSQQFETITGCFVDFSQSANMMEFLRRIGFLTKANIDWLGRSTNSTTKVFLARLLHHSISDANSLDVLGWLIPGYFDVNHPVQSFRDHWLDVARRYEFMRGSAQARNHNFSRTVLQASSLAGNIHAVRLFLDLGADPYHTIKPQDYSALEYVASLENHDRAAIIADLLLSKQTSSSSQYQVDALEGALQLAIAKCHTELLVRILSERKRLGNGAICSQHFTIAAKYADHDTIRLLVDHSQRRIDGSITLPKDILFAAFSRYPCNDSLELLVDKFTYLLELGADPKTLRCKRGCRSSFILSYIIGRSLQFGGIGKGEECALKLSKVLREHGCPSERPKSASGGDNQPSALQAAIRRGYPLLVEYLLDWGIDIDHYQGNLESQTSRCDTCTFDGDCMSHIKGQSPLLTALAHRRTDLAKMLLRRHHNLKLRGGEQRLAMKAGDDTELVDMLLEAGSANIDGLKEFLEQAILRQNPRSTRLLVLYMDHHGHTDIDPTTLLRAAILVGHLDMAYQEIAMCKYDPRALFEAVSQSYRCEDYQKIVERLLETRPNISNDGFEARAVISAAMYGNMSLLSVLMKALGQGPWNASFPGLLANEKDTFLSRWVPDDDEPGTPAHILDYAASLNTYCEDETVLKLLLEVNVPAEGMKIESYYDLAAETWKKLIAAGAHPKHLDLLFSAVECNMLAHVEVLCEAQAPVNTMHVFNISASDTLYSRTAVQLAVESGSLEMLQMLIHYGGDVEHPAGYRRGATCLQLAAGAGNIGLVRLLLKNGAKVNARRSLFYGRTSIETAAENERLDVLKLLLLQDKRLYQTTAERYQFIRATKMAKNNGHGVIEKMLREHINWNSEDQRLFDEIQGSTYLIIHLDDMTEMLLDSEKGDSEFWRTSDEISSTIGFQNIYDIDGIEQWIGEFAEETSDDSTTAGIECNSEGEDRMTPENGVITSQSRTAAQEITVPAGEPRSQAELQSGVLQHEKMLPAYEDIHDASVKPTDLQDDSDWTGEPSAMQRHAWMVNSETDRWTQTPAHALRYQDRNPLWLEMEDDGIDNMMQDLWGGGGGPITKDRTWEALAHGSATQIAHREPGMVLGEVLGDAPHINDMGDDAFVHNVEDIGEAEHSHMSQFNWGLWDEESFEFHSTAWENWNIGTVLGIGGGLIPMPRG